MIYPGVYRARVLGELTGGQLLVSVPAVTGPARVVAQPSHSFTEFVTPQIPEVGDPIWIIYESANPAYPVWLAISDSTEAEARIADLDNRVDILEMVTPLERFEATVTAVPLGVATVQLSESGATVPGVPHLESYNPFVGDTVYVDYINGISPLIIGSVAPSPSSGGAWTPVLGGVGFLNSWVNFGSNHTTAAWRVDSRGWAHLKGTVKSGSSPTAVMFNLPAEARPAFDSGLRNLFRTVSNNGICLVHVDADNGNVTAERNGSTNFTCLNGITYPTPAAFNRRDWHPIRTISGKWENPPLHTAPALHIRDDGFVVVKGILQSISTTAGKIHEIYDAMPEKTIIQTGWSLDGSTDRDIRLDAHGTGIGSRDINAGSSTIGGTYLNLQGHWHAYANTLTWTAPTLLNSWVNYSTLGPGDLVWENASHAKDDYDMVHVRGLIRAGTTTAGTDLFVLPVGRRPLERYIFPASASGTFGRIDVLPTGEVEIHIGSSTYTSLSDIMFLAEQ